MIFASSLDSPEGPVANVDGSFYCVEMGAQTGCVSKISRDGSVIEQLAHTGRPNGLAVDRTGTIWVAESSNPSLLKMTPEGEYVTWLESDFIFPNDLAFGPDGLLYMTDSGIYTYELAPDGMIRSDFQTLKYDGKVFQIDVILRKVRIIDSGLQFANGIAYGPDDRLYINETITGNVFRYKIAGGTVESRELFGNVNDPEGPPGWRGPDGMKFDQSGNLYCTVYGQKDVTVLNQQGKVIRRIKTQGRLPTNLAFGYGGQRKIYVTEVELGQIEVFDVDAPGYQLFT